MSREVLDFSHYRQLVLFWGLLDLVIRSAIASIMPSFIAITSIIPYKKRLWKAAEDYEI